MLQEPFSHKFPEWQLEQALKEATNRSPAAFWERLIVHFQHNPDAPTSLARWFPDAAAASLVLENQAAFAKDGALRYHIDPERYRQTYWGLRPDFTVQSPDLSTLIFLEAKGGQPNPATWIDPKELRYYEFLQECKAAMSKAFLYIVPAIEKQACANCLSTYFSSNPSIRVGIIFWEDLFPVIHERLIGVALDYILINMEGVKLLRAWQRGNV